LDASAHVLLAQEPGADAELDATVRELVKCGDVLSQHGWLAKVVGDHQRANAQRARGLRDRGQSGQRRKLRSERFVDEMIANEKGRKAEGCCLAGGFEDMRGIGVSLDKQPKAEGMHGGLNTPSAGRGCVFDARQLDGG
jgi:hypothetical protein